jgi:hypothetical protein
MELDLNDASVVDGEKNILDACQGIIDAAGMTAE